jgi:hypothetical protein
MSKPVHLTYLIINIARITFFITNFLNIASSVCNAILNSKIAAKKDDNIILVYSKILCVSTMYIMLTTLVQRSKNPLPCPVIIVKYYKTSRNKLNA